MNRTLLLILAALVIVGGVAAFLVLSGDDSGDEVAASTTTSQAAAPGTDSTAAPDTTLPAESTTTTSSAPGYTPVFEEADCAFDLITEREHRCGYLVVPEDRSNPDNGREVRIHFTVFESDNPNAPEDPIVYLDGGPGGESLAALQFSLEPTWSDFLDTRHMVFFDQRGVGLSTPSLECPETRELELDILDEDLAVDEYLALEQTALAACRSRIEAEGTDVTQYNSAANAADVADLRVALGIDEWNLLGISYGTRLAETVMRDHPEGIRSVILDSTYAPDNDLLQFFPENTERAFAVLFAGCANEPDCAAAYPNLEQRFYDLVVELDATPIETTVRDVLNDNTEYVALIDGASLIGTYFQGLYSAEIIPILPQLVADLEQGETTNLSLLWTNFLANGEFFSYGMNLSVQCNEEVPFTDEAAVAAAAAAGDPRLAEFYASSSNTGLPAYEICELWQAGVADPVENEPVVSDIPTLVMAGEYDPITPPAWGQSAAATLTNATYVEFPGVGHGASLSADCPLSIAEAFLDDPTAPVDTTCVDEMGPPNFAVPGGGPPPIVLTPFEQDIFGILVEGVVPEDWESVGPGAWVRGLSAVDQTAIVQQAAPGLGDPDLLVGLLGPQLGFEDEPEPQGSLTVGDRTWDLYQGTIDGFTADLVLGTSGTVTGIVVMISDPAERGFLYDELLLPALEAFRAS